MTTNQQPTSRGRAEISAGTANDALDDFFERRKQGWVVTPDQEVATAQADFLAAIYYELRHGHDQAARHAAAMEAQTKVMADLAHQLEKVAGHLGHR